ncbi:MAG: hypothetical protein JXA28_06265 [Bacteroidetes bacterium]|nr:hypothetical protein [Bacteroidota bacterium]
MKPLSTTPELSRTERRVLWAVGVFVVLRACTALVDVEGLRLWGLDFFSVLEGPLPGLLVSLPLLFALPPVARMFAVRRERQDENSHGVRIIVVAGLTVAAGVIAWSVNVGYAFLGDGTWYPAELYRSIHLPDYANSMIKPSAWLTGMLLDGVAVAFRPEDLRVPFVLAGCAGAVIATGAVLFATRRERGHITLAAAVILLGAPGTLLFLGYIELYALVYALSIAYLVTAWQCFRGNAPVWIPGVLLLVAILFGASAVVWLPSFLLLLHWKLRGEEGIFPLRRALRAYRLHGCRRAAADEHLYRV